MSSNIKVGIRVRPLISREQNEKLKEQWEVKENSMYPFDVNSGKRNGDIYYFDHIFDSSYCNADIYSTIVHPVVDKAMNGFNGTIFAYGQTSSGKTYTMMGDASEDGLISLAVQNIFLAIEQSVNRKFLLRVSYMEIYNEKIYDLLDTKNTVKISEDYNGSVIVKVKEEVTDSAEKVYDIMKKGDKARRIGETNMNEKSSRSHTIFRIIIETSDISDTSVVNIAHLNLVDLAGSERATLTKTTGQRLKEGAHINKSLSTLSLVMKQLSESQDFINFRDSKLTRILQPSLGGNALTAIICAVTPAALEETHSTLAFASRAKTVKNKPLLNEVVTDEALINRYALEINKLKQDLEKANERTLQLEKISVLEKCILFSKKSNNTNKNRRKTWSAPNDPNRTLSIIYETDVLRVSDSNLVSEALPFDDYRLTSHSFEKKSIAPCTSPRSNTLSQPVKKSEDVVKWLIHSETETPKSVLRERAEYYEQEFNSLKELTSRENFILMTDHTAEMEILQAELIHIKSELERDKIVKREQETKFLEEKKKLELKLDEVKKKNDELSKILQKVQKDNEQQNDCEYLVDMYKEKYKKREKELLDSLQEAREQLKSNINNTDDEKYQIISTDVSISVDMKVFLEECKNQLRVLKLELESEQPMSIIKKIFNEIKKLNEEMLVNCTDCSEDLQDLLNVFKFMFDLSSILLTDDVVILELEKEKFQLQHREKTYELLVSKQDEEIKHLSENILQYMNELAFHKNEVTKYKEIAKSETSLHTDLDFSIMTTDTKNMTDYDLNNESTFNQSELILKSDQYVQTEEDFLGLIQSKDKEIEDLSDKIMEYIEQLMALEQEFNQLKSVSKADKSFLDNKLMKEKDDKITELTKAVYKNDEKIIKYVAELQSEKEKVQEKDTEIEDLSDNIMNYLSEISNLNDEINLMNVQLQSEKDLINTKDEEIKNLILQIEELKTKLFDTNDQELTELTEKVKSSEQLFVQENYESFIKAKNPDVRDTDRNIKDLLSKVTEYKIKINAVENELSGIKEELQEYKLKMQEDKKIIQLKDNQIAVLNDQIIDLTETMHASQNELEKCNNLITTKDIEIQELLCKLTDAENEICDCKSNADIDNDIIECKNKEIKEIRADIINYTNKLSTADAMIQEYQSDLKLQKDLTDSKTKEFDKLADNIFDYVHKLSITETNLEKCENDLKIEKELLNIKVSEIEKLSSDILDYVTHLSTAEEEIKTYKSDLQNQNKLLKLKDEEIEELSSQIMDYIDQLSAVESELNKCKSSGDTESDQILLKTKEVQELTSKIVNYEKQLISTEEKIKNYKSDIEEKIELLDSKNTEIEDLMKKVTIFGNQINEFEKLTELKNLEIQELHSKILYCNKQIKEYQVYESQLEEYENLIKLKDDEIKNVTKKLVKFKDDIFEKNKIINNYMRDLEIEKDTSKKTDEHIQNIKKEYYKQITEFEEAIDNLKSALNKKDEIIVHRENDIKSLNDKINQYSKQLDALNLRNEKLTQHSSEYEMFRMKIIAEEVKSIEYVNKIKSLEQQLLLSNDQAKQMEQEYEVVKTSNLNYCTMIKSLQNEICTLQGHVAQQECSFKQYKDELGLERNIILENDTLLRDTNLTEMQKATDKLQKNRNHIENLQKELVSVQNNNTELTKEIAKLKKKNEDYKKIVAEVTERANSKIGSYNNIGIKLKRDNDLLKMQIRAEEEKNIKTLNQLIVVQEELKKKDNSYEIDKLQTKINNLEEKNKKLVEIIEDYQEQLYMKGNEFNAMKKTVETLKYENSELHQINRNLNDKLYETEVLLKSARSNVQLLEKENEHYNNSSRNLEESLEDLKFELYELKNKEREKFKKAKRQSLHDSSRSLSSDEQLNINNENQQLKLPFFESNKSDETKSNECEKCKQRMPLSDRQIDEQRDKVTKLQKDNEILRKKCDQVQNLCRARKNKIDELEKQVQAYKTQ